MANRLSERKRLQHSVQRLRPLGGYACAVGGVGAATSLFWVLHAYLDPWQASLLYLPLIIACATRFGFGPAVLGALLSFMCWDYFFLPPIYHLAIFSRRDTVLLLVFLIAALTTAHLGSRVRRQAREAVARERETALLHEASLAISREVASDKLLPTLVQQVVQTCRASWCAVLNRRVPLDLSDSSLLEVAAVASEEALASEIESLTQSLVAGGVFSRGPKGISLPLEVEGKSVGIMYAGGKEDGTLFTPQEERVLLTLANHAAVIIARGYLAEEAQQQTRQAAVLEERNRLAQDVHDTLSHTFTGIKFLLEAADRLGSSPQASECISQARQMAVEGAQEARRSVWALRPATLEESGSLTAALQRLVSQQTEGTPLCVSVSITGTPQPLSSVIEENLLRICQESLTNVLRHAHATTAEITLAFAHDCLTLVIQDNGIGFDPVPKTGIDHRDTDGFGLISMRERSERLGGALCITSRIRHGTQIRVQIPLMRSE